MANGADAQTHASPGESGVEKDASQCVANEHELVVVHDAMAGESCAGGIEDAPADQMAEEEELPDETTGASPGTAQACTDLGLNSLEANLARFNIKPPGVS